MPDAPGTESLLAALVGVWFTNKAGWDRGIDHAATPEEASKDAGGKTLCGRTLGRRFVFSGDRFDPRAGYSCKTCRRVADRA